jgi:hypothetical protein
VLALLPQIRLYEYRSLRPLPLLFRYAWGHPGVTKAGGSGHSDAVNRVAVTIEVVNRSPDLSNAYVIAVR